jgi:hypothetical protein
MLKHSLLYLILSILVVVFAKYVQIIIVYIDLLYVRFTVQLAPFFSNSESGYIIRNVLSLVLIPVILVGIPALIYRMMTKKDLPYFMEITGFLWLIIVLSKVLLQ